MSAASAPETTVRRYVDAFNGGDIEQMAACFASAATILDGMAPHVWHGPTAARDWYRDVLVEGEHQGAGGYVVSLAAPAHTNITGDSAYAVFPATMTFTLRGARIVQSGAVFTTALRRIDGDWRLVAWAWTKGTPQAL